jgi:putative salt-induced outer membrane protein YdiY
LILVKWSKRLVLLCALSCGSAFGQTVLGQTSDLPPVLPPPGSGLLAPQSDVLSFDPLPNSLTEPNATEGLLKDLLAEAIEAEGVVLADPARWYAPTYWFGPAPWDIGIEFGLNGGEGVNESMSLRSGGHLKRKTRRWKFDTSLAYNKNSANNIETQNNALLDLRVDRRMKESLWSLYFLHQTLYDEFQAYDLRVSANAGVGYRLFDTETIDFLGRFGAGSSREFGGPDEEWAPEALMGLDYEHEITGMQRFSAKVDYYPEWDQFDQYRVVSDVGWEIDLDRPKSLSLKFSVVDRYDSTPNGVQPNELNYSALLIWGL